MTQKLQKTLKVEVNWTSSDDEQLFEYALSLALVDSTMWDMVLLKMTNIKGVIVQHLGSGAKLILDVVTDDKVEAAGRITEMETSLGEIITEYDILDRSFS